MTKTYRGVFPALVSPQDQSGKILFDAMGDMAQRHVAAGAGGFLVNGHTGELMLLSGDERREALATVRAAVGPDVPLVAGVHVQAAWKFPAQAESAAEMGADAVLLFSPFAFARGAFNYAPEAVVDYYRRSAEASPIPLFFMQYRPQTNLMMPEHVLAMVAALPNVVGIKQEVEDDVHYESNLAALKKANPDIAVLSASDLGLLGNYLIGADGCTIGLANFVELVKPVQDAAWAGDLEGARRASARLRIVSDAIYRPPSYRWSARLKYAVKAMGWMPTEHIRSPLFPATEQERAAVDEALAQVQVTA